MSDWGLKVALPGYDTATATPDQCALHSSYASPKIKKNQSPTHRGVLQIIFNTTYAVGETTIDSFAHGYTYAPMIWAVATTGGGDFGFQPYVNGLLTIDMRAGTSNIITVVNNQSLIGPVLLQFTLNFSYAIFAEQGA